MAKKIVFIILLCALLLFQDAAMAAESGDSLFNRAISAYNEKKLITAAEMFGKAGEAYSKEKKDLKAAQCFYNQGLCLSGSAQSKPVTEAFERAASLYRKAKNAPGESQSLLQAAQIYINGMQWDRAREHYERCLKTAGKDITVLGMASEGLGRIHREQNNLAEAEKYLKTADTAYKNNPGGRLRVRLQLAYITGLRGRQDEALSMYDSAIEEAAAMQKRQETRDEGELMAFFARSDKGEFLLQAGAFGEAKTALEEALALGERLEASIPSNSEAMLALKTDHAQSLMYLGNFSGAASELNTLLSFAVGSDNTALSMKVNAALGTLARMRGDYEGAAALFENFRSIAEKSGQTQSLAQALIQQAALFSQTGVWSEAAAYYHEAFITALKAQDMDSTLRAMQGIYESDIKNELGLVGKVDYKTSQGLPWRAAFTVRHLYEKARPGFEDLGFIQAWRTIDSQRSDSPIPSLDGFRMIREIAMRNAPEIREYYTETKIGWAIGDAILRSTSSRLRSARNAEEALRELASRQDEAVDKKYVQMAFQTTLNLLRSLAGEGMLSALPEELYVQIGGIFVEGSEPDGSAASGQGGIGEDIQTLSRMIALTSPKASETEEMQKALLAGNPIPEAIRTRLRKTLFSRASRPPKSDGELLDVLYRILENTNPSLKKDIGLLAEGEGLINYTANNLKLERESLSKEAAALLPQTSPYLLLSIDAGDEMVRFLDAWANMRGRAVIMKELGISLTTDADWTKFLPKLGSAFGQADEVFKKTFALKLDDAAAAAEGAARLRDLAEKLAFMKLVDEGRNIASILASGDNVSYDDRMSILELQSRIRYAMSSPERAEESAENVLSMLGASSADISVESQPEIQWRVYGMMARIAEDRGDFSEASRLYNVALSRIEAIHPIEGTTSQSTADRTALYGGAIRTKYEIWSADPSGENVEKLWLALENMKSRQWREMLATTGGEFLNALPPEDREKVRELEIQRVALEGAYRSANFRGQREEALRINDDIRKLREQRLELTKNRTIDVDSTPGIAPVKERLPKDWGLANYYLSPELSFAIVLTRGGEAAVTPLDIDYDSLFGYSYWMRYKDKSGIGEYDESKFLSPGRPRVTTCGLSPEDVASKIFDPVASACGKLRKLLIIPHDILYVLPIEALQRKDGKGATFLVHDWTLAELPSAFLLTRERAEAKNDRALMLVANPAYATLLSSIKHPASLKIALENDPKLREIISAQIGDENLNGVISNKLPSEERDKVTSALKKAWEKELSETEKVSLLALKIKKEFGPHLTLLDNSQSEAINVGRIWKKNGGGDPAMLLSSMASEGEFWNNNPGQYRYVHIACHGYDRGTIPDLQPGLALSPIRDPSNDSFLQMGELSTVRWNSELVTLSACETGLGDLYIGDGMFGLSTVLLAGGVKGAILTRWRAVDESAPILMNEFYSRLFAGKPPADALHEAQIAMVEGGGNHAPRHWAVFKYVGIPW
ncbi:MAG: CHAT domain-containing protein [Synergistaceae bacterium]|nr:CHAT domain-containing protein [Synergistaceae bacterium]